MEKINKRGLLLLIFIPLATFSSAIITPALPEIETFYRLGDGALEWVISIFLIGYTLGQLIYGPLANKIGRVSALRLGLVLNLLGLIMCFTAYYTPHYSLLLIGRFFSALGSSSALVCAFVIINEALEARMAKTTIAYTSLAFSTSMAMAIFIGGFITSLFGWQYCFLVAFIYGLAMLMLTHYLPETHNHEELTKHRSVKISTRQFVKLLFFSLVAGASSCFVYSYTTAAPTIAHLNFDFTPLVYGTWSLVNLVGMLTGGFSSAVVIHNLGGVKVIKIAFVIFLVGASSFLLNSLLMEPHPVWFFSTGALMYFANAWIFGSASFYASNTLANRALGASLMSFFNVSSAVLSVILLGYLPFKMLLALPITLYICISISLGCFIWILKKERPAH